MWAFILATHNSMTPFRKGMARTVWGTLSFVSGCICLLIAIFLFGDFSSTKTEYTQYCGGIIVTQSCNQALSRIDFLQFLYTFCGIFGIAFCFMGIYLIFTSQQHVIYVPQPSVQFVQPQFQQLPQPIPQFQQLPQPIPQFQQLPQPIPQFQQPDRSDELLKELVDSTPQQVQQKIDTSILDDLL